MRVLGLLSAMAAGATMVASCASTPDLLAEGPRETLAIQRPIAAVRDCLVEIGPNIEVLPYQSGYMVRIKDLLTGFVRLSPDGDGTKAEGFGSAAGRSWKQLIERCSA